VYLEVARPNVLAGSRGQDLETTRQRLVHEIVQFRKKKWSARQLAETS